MRQKGKQASKQAKLRAVTAVSGVEKTSAWPLVEGEGGLIRAAKKQAC